MATLNGVIKFEDDKVRTILTNQLHIDQYSYDNQISYAEACNVKSIDTWFKGENIEYFDELGYFESLPIVEMGAFMDCSDLVYITIPKNVSVIGKDAFRWCCSLTILTCNATTPPALGNNAFFGVVKPSGNVSGTAIAIDHYPYAVKKDDIILCNGTDYAMRVATEDMDVDDPSNGKWRFVYTTSVGSMYDVNGDTYYLYRGDIGEDDAQWKLVKRGNTDVDSFKIYVPDNSVETYKTNRYWSQYADIIFPLRDRPPYNMPIFKPETESGHTSAITVTIGAPINGVNIYITTDNSVPVISETLRFKEPFTLKHNTIVHALGVRDGDDNGYYAGKYYSFRNTVIAPSFSPSGDEGVLFITGDTTVEITSITPNAEIYYTLDGSNPTTASNKYTGALTISESVVIKAIASRELYNNSKIVSLRVIRKHIIEFEDKTVEDILLANGVDTDGDGKISDYEMANVTSIGGWFTGSTITSFDEFKYFTSIKVIGNYSFSGCTELEKITIPDNVLRIAAGAFAGCEKLSDVDFGNGVMTIDGNAFLGCSNLVSVVLPDSVKTIKEDAFKNCVSLRTVTIGDGLLNIHPDAFQSCSLRNLTIKAEKPPILNGKRFSGVSRHFKIWVPSDSVDRYKEASGWKDYKGIIYPIIEETDDIIEFEDDDVFDILLKRRVDSNGSNNITKDEIEAIHGISTWFKESNIKSFNEFEMFVNVHVIPESAFANCTALNEILIPSNITEIGEFAFYNCSNIEALTLGDKVSNIGNNAFMNCEKMTSFTMLAKTPPTIGKNVFANINPEFKIYVPLEALSNYKEQWSDYVDYIYEYDIKTAVGFYEDYEDIGMVAEVGDIFLYRTVDPIDGYTSCKCTESEHDVAYFDEKYIDEVGTPYYVGDVLYILNESMVWESKG